jgi:hypothetical protein
MLLVLEFMAAYSEVRHSHTVRAVTYKQRFPVCVSRNSVIPRMNVCISKSDYEYK